MRKWRKRLWGGKSAEQQDKSAEKVEPDEDDTYVPATTWDGLQRVGGKKSLEEFEKEWSWEEGFVVSSSMRGTPKLTWWSLDSCCLPSSSQKMTS